MISRIDFRKFTERGANAFTDLVGPLALREHDPLVIPKEVLYVFVTKNQDLRIELLRLGAGAVCFAKEPAEIITWLMTACRSVFDFGTPNDEVYRFEFVSVQSEQEIDAFIAEHGEYFSTSTLELSRVAESDVHVYLAFAGVLIGKNVGAQYYQIWMIRRLQAFFGLLHIRDIEMKPKVSYENAAMMHLEFERSLCVRRIMFYALLYGSQLDHYVRALYVLAVDLLRFTKMTGLAMVMTFLLTDSIFPILFLDRWAPDRRNLIEALELWLSYPPCEQPFLRILYHDIDMRPLGGPRLERLVYAALLIGQRYFPNLNNIVFRVTANKDIIRKDVEYWLGKQSLGAFYPEKGIPMLPGRLYVKEIEQKVLSRVYRSEDHVPDLAAIEGKPAEQDEEESAEDKV